MARLPTLSKAVEDQIHREHYDQGISYRDLGKKYGYTAPGIQQICKRVEERGGPALDLQCDVDSMIKHAKTVVNSTSKGTDLLNAVRALDLLRTMKRSVTPEEEEGVSGLSLEDL